MSDLEGTDFEKLYQLYSRDVFNMGLRNSGCNQELAKDATQQAFLKLYLTMRDKKPVKNIRNFLLTAAKHYVLNAQRVNKHEYYVGNPSASAQEGMWIDDVEGQYIRKLELEERQEKAQQLLDELKRKNEKWYIVAKEVFYNQRSQIEVARELGMNDTAMYAMVRRIREWAESYMKDT